jgi:hypothetical protein
MKQPFMTAIIQELRAANSEFDGTSIISKKNGRMIMWPPAPGVVGKDFSKRNYVQIVLETGEPYFSDPFQALSGNYIVVVSAPIYVDGKRMGVFTGSFHLAKDIEKLSVLDKRDGQQDIFEGFFSRDRISALHRLKKH